jgi:hypothetical protein
MKNKLLQILSLLLALLLQVAPLLRPFLPTQGLAPSAWAVILKLGVGTIALLGFDAVSQASSISISPANATVGQPYVGTISYSGGHSGSVRSMSLTNTCLGSPALFLDGLTIVYSGANVATVTGTPTNAASYGFALKIYDNSTCSTGGNSDTRSATLIVGSSGGGAVAPTISAAPVNVCAQVGSDVQLSGGADGNPIPQYQWWSGLTPIAGATNSVLTITNVQLANAGVYTMTASNSQTAGFSFGALPKANCYLSVAISGGTNFTTFNYTNFAPAGTPLTLFSWFTNVATSTNYYSWTYNRVNVISTSNTIPFIAPAAVAALTPAKSGIYTVSLNSTNSGGAVLYGQNYDSYWAFGYVPMFTNSLPAATNINAGSSVTFSIAIGGTLNVYNGAGGAGAYATNSGAPCVFWYQNGSLVAAQTYTNGPTSLTTYSNAIVTASLTINNATSANAGNYTVVVTNFWGSSTSGVSALAVGSTIAAPLIITQPAVRSVLSGQTANFSITAAGAAPLSYQWQKNNLNLSPGGIYSGVYSNVLSLTGVSPGDGGNYSVVVTNAAGSTNSQAASLTVALPPSLGLSGGGSGLQFSASTFSGLVYVVQTTTNLAVPWTPVATNTVPGNGLLLFTNPTINPAQFFRLQFP